MKRRLLALALVLAMIFSLCACGSNTGTDIVSAGQIVQEGKEKLASVENCHLVLRLTINPQLELYLDENGTVLKAVAGNQDGEALLANLDLTGLSYSDAVSAILSGAEEQNVLPEKANVQIDVLACADGSLTFEQTQLLEQAVTDYDAELTPFVDQSAAVAASCGADMVEIEHSENGDVWYEYYSNMTCIRAVRYGADGSYTHWVYLDGRTCTELISISPDGTRDEQYYTYYENGVQKTSDHVTIHPDGSRDEERSTYYENGVQKTSDHVTIHPDGTHAEQHYTYDENGVEKTRDCVTIYPDGTRKEEHSTYYKNGGQKPNTIVTIYPDGSRDEAHFTYDENGNTKTENYVWADGSTAEHSYNENGVVIYSKVVRADGTVREDHYYENGNLKSREETLPDGTVREEQCHENGIRQMWKEVRPDGSSRLVESDADRDGAMTSFVNTYANGDWEKEVYYPSGRIQIREGSVGGEYYIYNYDENGRYYENGEWIAEEVLPDGTVRKYHYDENGNLKFREETLPDGTVRKEQHYENGSLKVLEETRPDGSSRLEEYDANGVRIFHMYTYANGDWEKVVCYPDGRPKCEEGSIGGEYYIYNYDENGQLIE